ETLNLDDVQDAARRLAAAIDRTILRDPGRAPSAADLVGGLRYRVAEAILAAFPQAGTIQHRLDLLHVLDHTAFPWHFEAVDFLESVACDDPTSGCGTRRRTSGPISCGRSFPTKTGRPPAA